MKFIQLLNEAKIPNEIDLNIDIKKYNIRPQETPKLEILIGIKVQEELKKSGHSFRSELIKKIDIINGKLILVLSAKGKFAIKIRSKDEPKYLDIITNAFRKIAKEKIEKLKR